MIILPFIRIGHQGSMNGFWADFNRFVDDDLVIIVLSNFNMTPVEHISQHLAEISLGEDEDVQELESLSMIQMNLPEMKLIAGIYLYRDRNQQEHPTQENVKEVLEHLSEMDVSNIAVGYFHKIFEQYGIDAYGTLIVTCENDRLYLFMPKNHWAWFKYEIIPVAHQKNSTTWIAKSIDEKVIFNVEQDGAVHLIHFDVNGHETHAVKI